MRMEDTKEVGTDELQVLKRMVLAWKEDYTGSVPSDGGGEYLCQDFSHGDRGVPLPLFKKDGRD